MNITKEFLSEQLKRVGIRPSYQRVRVLEYLYQKGGHPTVDEIFCSLFPEIPSLSKVTVYNTLHALIKAGLVRDIDIESSEMHYDITVTSHGHFQCESCRNIFNFQVNIDQIAAIGLEQFDIKQKNIYFKGLCPDCRKQSNHE